MSARFCAACGAALAGAGVHAHRVCSACGQPSYANPAVHAACVLHPPDGPVRLAGARLEPGETIQDGALRALGASTTAPPRLALYCALTDLDQGAVWLIFRTRGAPARAAQASEREVPGWAAGLCGRYLADCAAGRLPVYTASLAGGDLSFTEVPAESAALSPRRR